MMDAIAAPATSPLVVSVQRARELLARARTVEEVVDLRNKAEAMRIYLLRRDAASDAHADAWEIVQHANRRLGQIIASLPKAQGGRTDLRPLPPGIETKGMALQRHRITRVTANRYERLALLSDQEFEARVIEQKPKAQRWCTAPTLDSDERITPDKYLEAARVVLGAIDLDPASNEEANAVVRASRFFSKADNGLAQRWKASTLFLHPPPSDADSFVNKCTSEHDNGSFAAAIVLLNNVTETRHFQSLLARGVTCFCNERIPFVLNGKPVPTSIGQAFFYLGRGAEHFREVFAQFGTVVAAR
jgi:hypothetical protein